VKACLRTPLKELTGHNSVVISADWLCAGDQVVTASWDRTAILFDAETGDCVTVLTGMWYLIKLISRLATFFISFHFTTLDLFVR